MKEYYHKLKNPLESMNKRAPELCFIKIPFLEGKFDYQFGKDIMDFNIGLFEMESFCNSYGLNFSQYLTCEFYNES